MLAFEREVNHVLAHCLGQAPIATGADIFTAAAESAEGRPTIVVEFSDEAGRRFHEYTREHIDSVIAVVLDGEVAMAPIIREPVAGGTIAITLAPPASMADAQRIALQLGAAAVGLRLVRSDVVRPGYSPIFGRPVTIGVGILATLCWMLLLMLRRASWPWLAVAAFPTAAVVAECLALSLGASLTAATHLGALIAALGAFAAVALGALRGSHLPIGQRLLVSWPSLLAIGAVFVLGSFAARSPGFWRGVSFTLASGTAAAALIALLGIVALRQDTAGAASDE